MAALIEMLTKSFPGGEIRTVRQDELKCSYSEVKYYSAQTLKSKLKKFVGLNKPVSYSVEYFPTIANEFPEYGERWAHNQSGQASKDFLPLLQWADLVIHNAELLNYSHNKISCRGAFLSWFSKTYLGKATAMVNQTTPALGSDLMMEGLLEFVCPQLDVVTAREPRSQETLHRLGIEATLVPDPVFSIEPDFSKLSQVEDWKKSVGLTSPYVCLSFISVFAHKVAQRKESIVPLIKVVKSITEYGMQVVLMDAGGGSLRRVNEEISRQTNTFLFREDYTNFWSLLKGAEAIVTGHYHNIIMAAIVGCPFLPFRSVSHKVESLCELLEWPIPPINPTCLMDKTAEPRPDLALIRSNLEIILSDRAGLSEQLSRKANELKLKSQLTGQLLKDIV